MHRADTIAVQFAVTAFILLVIVWRKLDSGLHKFLLLMVALTAFCAGSATRFF